MPTADSSPTLSLMKTNSPWCSVTNWATTWEEHRRLHVTVGHLAKDKPITGPEKAVRHSSEILKEQPSNSLSSTLPMVQAHGLILRAVMRHESIARFTVIHRPNVA